MLLRIKNIFFVVFSFFTLLSVSKSFADDKDLTFEEMQQQAEQPSMKLIHKYRAQIQQQNHQQDQTQLLNELTALFEKHPRAFIIFHARDSEVVYSWLDALSLFHPLHDEFMKSFALVRTSSSAGFSSGNRGVARRTPLLYRDPQGYVRHLVKQGIDVQRLISGKEEIVALISGDTGVQATGAIATLIAAFKDHPRFHEIALNIARNYTIYKGSNQSLVHLDKQSLLKQLEEAKEKNTSPDEVVNLFMQLNAETMPREFYSLRGYINWSGSSTGFDSEGNATFNDDMKNGARALSTLASIYDSWTAENLQLAGARLIEKRVATRREFLGNKTPVKAYKIKRPPVEALSGILQEGQDILLRSPKNKYTIEKAGYRNNSIASYTIVEKRKDGRRFTLIVPAHPGYADLLQETLKQMTLMQQMGLLSRKSIQRIEGKGRDFILLPENTAFLDWMNQSQLKSKFLITTGKGKKRFNVEEQIKETDETRIYRISDRSGRKYQLTVPKNMMDADHVEKIEKEVKRTAKYKESGIAALPIFEYGRYFIIKPLVEGKLFCDVIKAWEAAGHPEDDAEVNAMLDLFQGNAKKGIYLARSLSENFMVYKDKIISIRPGAIKADMSYEDIMKEYERALPERFGRHFVERLLRR